MAQRYHPFHSSPSDRREHQHLPQRDTAHLRIFGHEALHPRTVCLAAQSHHLFTTCQSTTLCEQAALGAFVKSAAYLLNGCIQTRGCGQRPAEETRISRPTFPTFAYRLIPRLGQVGIENSVSGTALAKVEVKAPVLGTSLSCATSTDPFSPAIAAGSETLRMT